jgi:hypothetical protein
MPRCRDSRVAESNRSAPVAGAHVSGICIFIVLIYPRKVRGREVHGPAPAQHVGDQRQDGGALDEISIAADPLYLHLLLTAEKKFWRRVSFGESPRLFGEPTLETR